MSTQASGNASNIRPDFTLPDHSLAFDDQGAVRVSRKPRLPSPAAFTAPRPPNVSVVARAHPGRVAAVDQTTLLGVSRLSLARDLSVTRPAKDRVVVCYHPARRHLVLTPDQWSILNRFEGSQTVPAVLRQLIEHRCAVPLREYYELILQACDQGILQTPGLTPPAPVTPASWRFALPRVFLRPLGLGFIVTAFILLSLHPLQTPPHPLWWIAGWLVCCLAASLGTLLACGVLHDGEGLIRRPRLLLRSPFPRLIVEHDELPGTDLDADLAMSRIIPFTGLVVAASLYAPPLALPVFLGLLWTLSPFDKHGGLRLLRALRQAPRLSTAQHFRFRPNRTFVHHLRQRLDRHELRFLALRVGYCAPWLLIVILAWATTTRLDPVTLWQHAVDLGLPVFAFGALGALLVLAVFAALGLAFTLARESRRAHREVATPAPTNQTARAASFTPSTEDLVAFLGDTHPFQTLPAKHRERFVAGLRQTPFTAGETVIPAGDRRRRLYVLYSGAVEVVPPDGGKPVTTVEAGGIVGEGVLLLAHAAQPAEIRGLRPGLLLSINHEVYEDAVAPFVPRGKIEDAVQKIAFLRRIALSRHWSPHVLDGFARRSITQSFDYGVTLIEADCDNLWFFLLMEGELRVMRDGRKVGRLLPGDFFGEISLLRNSPTTAQLVGHHAGRCLAIPKTDFLAFLSQNPEIAMQIEALASHRLGRPVFSR